MLHILYDSNYTTFCKTMETVKMSLAARAGGEVEGGTNEQSRDDFQGSANALYDTIMVIHVIIHFYKSIDNTKSDP